METVYKKILGRAGRSPAQTPGRAGRPPARSHRRRPTALLVAAAIAAGVALMLAGCGSGSSNNGVAHLGSTSTAASTDPAGGGSTAPTAAQQAKLEKFSQCMRSHGVTNFPDPTDGRLMLRAGPGTGLNPNSPTFQSAMKACRSLAPQQSASPAQRAQLQAQALKFSQCMRSHGVPKFPDPNFSGGGMKLSLNGIDPNSPQFKSAQQACRSLAPHGVRQGG